MFDKYVCFFFIYYIYVWKIDIPIWIIFTTHVLLPVIQDRVARIEAFEASFESTNNESRIPTVFSILVQDCGENANRICEVQTFFVRILQILFLITRESKYINILFCLVQYFVDS